MANWDSSVGYAWWLMESHWIAISRHYADHYQTHLAYPSISDVPANIAAAPIAIHQQDFSFGGIGALREQLRFIRTHLIRTIYFTDRPAFSWRYLVYRAAGVQFIAIHDHTPGMRTSPRGLKRALKWMAQRMPGLAADVQIGASEFVRRRLIDVGCAPPEKCFCAPNGLPMQNFEPMDVHTEFGIPRHRKIFVTAARASKYKGIDFAMRALAATGRNDWHYLLCGDGPDLQRFRDIAAELRIEDQVTFAGTRPDVPNILLGCYAALHPSEGEVGYSLAILEYMRAGLPVIVPNNPSVTGATSRLTGIIYKNTQGAIQGILKLLKMPNYARSLGQHSREYVQTHHPIEKTHSALLAALERVMPVKALRKYPTRHAKKPASASITCVTSDRSAAAPTTRVPRED